MSLISNKLKILCSKKMLSILCLGFSSGLPVALTGGLLKAWFKIKGIDLAYVGLISLLGQPYAYKFCWAPLLDRSSFGWFKFLGHRKSWILFFQVIIILIITLMARLDPNHHALGLIICAGCLALMSASQDIVIDAYRVDVLTWMDRGLGTALSIEGWRIGLLISSSVGLILAEHLGWANTYLIMAAMMLVGIIGTFIGEPEGEIPRVESSIMRSISEPIKQFFTKEKAIYLLVLIILYKLGDVLSHSLSTMFFLDLNFTLSEIGKINNTISIIASLIGVFLAGLLMIKVDLYKSILFFGVLQGATNVLYVLLAIAGKNIGLTILVVLIENICSGMGTSALLALLTGLCDRKYAATQFALLSSVTAISRIYIGSIAGFLVKILGWKIFYLSTVIMAVPGIVLVLFLRRQIIACDPRIHGNVAYS